MNDPLLLEEAAHFVDEVVGPVVPFGRAVNGCGIEFILAHWRPALLRAGLRQLGGQPGSVSFYMEVGESNFRG